MTPSAESFARHALTAALATAALFPVGYLLATALPVLSHVEIARGVQIKSLGTIS